MTSDQTARIRGIVFDKDGTLTDFNATWMPGIIKATRMFSGDDDDLFERLMIAGGGDPETNRIVSGSVLGAGDLDDFMNCYLAIVPERSDEAEQLKNQVAAIFENSGTLNAKTPTDLSLLFDKLIDRDIKIGIPILTVLITISLVNLPVV